jgi:DHA3 family macrolide efflux protein-like MFS transporter
MEKEVSREQYIREKWKKNAALFLGGQGVSMFGSMLVHYAIMWYVTLKTGSGVFMTLFSVAAVLPMFFISPFGGVWADRFNKKYLINISDAAISVVTLFMAVMFFLGVENIWLLLVCSVIRSLGQGVQAPAVNALLPEIVPAESLTRINGISGSIQSVCMIGAPMAAGAVLAFAPVNFVMLLDVFTALIGIGIVLFFVKTPLAASGKTASVDYFKDIKDGLGYIKRNKFILKFIVFMAAFNVLSAPIAMLTPLQTARNFGNDVWRLSAAEIAFSAGMLLGGVIISAWGGFKNRSHSLIVACFLLGIETVLVGITGLFADFWIYIACLALAGLTLPLFMTPITAIFQTKVEKEYMGRVFGVFSMVSSLMMPLGIAVFGPLGDVISIDSILVWTGIAAFLSTFFIVGSRDLKRAGDFSLK